MTVDPADDQSTADGPVDRITSETMTVEAAAEALCDLAAAEPEQVSDALDGLRALVTDDGRDLDERTRAVAAVADFAARRPEHASDAVATIAAVLDDPSLEPTALRALSRVATGAPAAVDPYLEEVGRRLTDEPFPTRANALRVLAARAEDDPAALSRFASRLATVVVSEATLDAAEPELPAYERSRLDDQRVAEWRQRRRAASLLDDVASVDRDAVASELDRLCRVLDPERDRNVHLRERVLEVVRTVAEGSPEAALVARDPLLATVESGDDPAPLRAAAAGTLATMADAAFEATTEPARSAIPALGDLLEHEDASVRANAASFLSYLAQRYPREVATLTDLLVDRLDDEGVPVRAGVVWALAFVDTHAARDALEDAAESDPDPEIRTLAAELLTDGPA